MADGGNGFDGFIEVVPRTRGYRRWPDDVKARIVAESFQPGVRVVDVARQHGLAAHQLSEWRRRARQGELFLPAGWRLLLCPPLCRLRWSLRTLVRQRMPASSRLSLEAI